MLPTCHTLWTTKPRSALEACICGSWERDEPFAVVANTAQRSNDDADKAPGCGQRCRSSRSRSSGETICDIFADCFSEVRATIVRACETRTCTKSILHDSACAGACRWVWQRLSQAGRQASARACSMERHRVLWAPGAALEKNGKLNPSPRAIQ